MTSNGVVQMWLQIRPPEGNLLGMSALSFADVQRSTRKSQHHCSATMTEHVYRGNASKGIACHQLHYEFTRVRTFPLHKDC